MSKEFPTSELHKALTEAAAGIRSDAMSGYGRLWDAYAEAGKVLHSLIEQGAHDPTGDVSESASNRISLTAGLLQSTAIVEQVITSGYYWAASALLRQHMEALARIIHVRKGQLGTVRRPPSVGVLPFRLATNYGRLSELAHVSGGKLLGDLTGSEISDFVASPLPRYRKDWANILLAIHISHMITLACEIHYLHVEIFPGKILCEVNAQLYQVATMLKESGHWRQHDIEASW